MATVILVRHGRSIANAEGVLAGRTAGVTLDEVGRSQAVCTGERLSVVPLAGLVASPLERCRQTSQAILDRQAGSLAMSIDTGITECDYGQWQGRKLTDLAEEELWSVVLRQPSAAVFPAGESLAAMQARAVAAIRRHDAVFEAQHGPGAVWAAVSHGDIIKAVLADAFGMHLDLFQRIHVNPASASIVRYAADQPHVVSTNTDAGDLSWLRAEDPTNQGAANGDTANTVQVGGGAGTTAPPRAALF